MIQSELMDDHESVAEMTTSTQIVSNKIVDTLVVHAVNYGHWLFEVSTLQVA